MPCAPTWTSERPRSEVRNTKACVVRGIPKKPSAYAYAENCGTVSSIALGLATYDTNDLPTAVVC